MSPRPPDDNPPRPLDVAIVGHDALIAALPAHPVQLSHALLAYGFDFAIPVSWGEELLAEHALRALAARDAKRTSPIIFCACAAVRRRLLALGSELAGSLLSFVAPPVAAARYVRALQPTVPLRVTYVGACEPSHDPSIDAVIPADELLGQLEERGIAITRLPTLFESVIPPDRRRHFSLPGGCPSPEALALRAPHWRVRAISEDAFVPELAQLLLSSERTIVDVAPRLGCACCGTLGGADGRAENRRARLAGLEPPRSATPVLDHDVILSLRFGEAEHSSAPMNVRHDERDAAPNDSSQIAPQGPRASRMETLRVGGLRVLESARERSARRRIAVTPEGVATWRDGTLIAPPATHRDAARTPRDAPATADAPLPPRDSLSDHSADPDAPATESTR